MRLGLVLISLAFVAVCGPLLALAKAPPPSADAPVLVVARDAFRLVEDAGGQVIGPSTAPLAVLAAGDAHLIRRLHQSGAWLVLNGRWVAEICGVEL